MPVRPLWRRAVLGVWIFLAVGVITPIASARYVDRRGRSHSGRPELVQVTQTTACLRDALTALPPRAFGTARAPRAVVLHVNDRVRYQRIIGFGAAMTDSSAWLLYDELRPQARTQTLEALLASAASISTLSTFR